MWILSGSHAVSSTTWSYREVLYNYCRFGVESKFCALPEVISLRCELPTHFSKIQGGISVVGGPEIDQISDLMWQPISRWGWWQPRIGWLSMIQQRERKRNSSGWTFTKCIKDKPNELEKLKNTLTNFFQILFKITAILRFKKKKSTRNKTIKTQYKRYYLKLLQRHTRAGHFNPPSAAEINF